MTRRALTAVLAALALSFPAAGLRADEAPPVTAVLLDDAGSYVADDEPVIFRAPDSISLAASARTSAALDFRIEAGLGPVVGGEPLHSFSIRLEPPFGRRLVEGIYTGAQRFRDEVHPAMDISGDGAGCNGTAGEFVVHEADYDPATDQVRRFAASIRQLCDGVEPPLSAEIRFNSTVPLPALEAPYRLHFGGADTGWPEGPSRAARVTNIGNEAVLLGPAALTGQKAGAFRIESDGCAGRTLAPGEGCAVAVRFRPVEAPCSDGEPASSAQLRIPDATWRGYREVHLCHETHGVNGKIIGGSAGDGPATAIGMTPSGLAIRGETLFVTDVRNDVVRQVDLVTGDATVLTGTGRAGHWLDEYGGVGAVSGELAEPRGLTTTREGRLIVADSGNDRVRIVRRDMLDVIGGDGALDPGDGAHANQVKLAQPWGVATDEHFNVYVVETDKHRVRMLRGGHTISTLAGDGTPGFAGDGGPAIAARLTSPRGIAVANDGTIYIADAGNHRIRMIGPQGIMTTIAGTGTPGARGDGGPATLAQVHTPSGIALGPDGALYVADTGNGRVRRIEVNGMITTVAGGGSVPVADGLSATTVRLNDPHDVAVAPNGILFVSDPGSNRVWAVAFGTIELVAGNGSCCIGGLETHALSRQLAAPSGVVAGAADEVFFSEQYAHQIRRIGPDGSLSSVAGVGQPGFAGDGGPAASAKVSFPRSLARDALGNLFVADSGNARVRKIDTLGRISTIAGGGSGGPGSRATAARLSRPVGVAIEDDGDLYIADAGTSIVYRIDDDGILRIHAGRDDRPPGFSGDHGPAVAARLNAPSGVSVDEAGNVYIADTNNNRIRSVDTCGVITTVAGGGTKTTASGRATDVKLTRPEGVAVASDGGFFVADTGRHIVRDVSSTGYIDTDGYTAGGYFAGVPYDDQYVEFSATMARLLKSPRQVAIDASGDVLVADAGHGRVRRYAASSDDVDAPICTRGELHPVGPSRIHDERHEAGAFDVQVTGRGSVPLSGARAVLVNVTAANGDSTGSVRAYEAGTARPQATAVHHGAGESVAGTAVVPLSPDGRVTIYSSGRETRIVVDVLGWYSDGTTDAHGSRMVPIRPGRVLDTATGNGVNPGPRPAGSFGVRVSGRGGVPSSGVAAVAMRFTATKAASAGSLIAYACESSRPHQKTLHYAPGRTSVNETVVPIGEDGRVCLTTTGESTHLYGDVVGWFRDPSAEAEPPGRFTAVTPSHVLDTRTGTGTTPGARAAGSFSVQMGGRGGLPDRGISAVVVSVSASDARSNGYLQAFSGERPAMKTLHYVPSKTSATLAIVPVPASGSITLYTSGTSTQIAVDVLGFVS